MRLRLTPLCALFLARTAVAAPVDLSAGHLAVTWERGPGMKVSVRGVPVLRESHLRIVRPGWKGDFLNADEIEPKVTETREGDARIATLEFDTRLAWARYRFEVRPDDTVKATMSYRTKLEPAEIEWNTALINGNVLAGSPFKAETVEGPREGTVPLFPVSTNQWKSMLCPLVKKVSFETGLGGLDVDIRGSLPENSAFMLFDGRALAWDWAQANPIFWFGVGVPLIQPSQGEQSVTVTYRFRVPQTSAAKRSVVRRVAPLAVAQRPFQPDWPVIPLPKEMRTGSLPCRLRTVAIALPAKPSAAEKAAAGEIREELQRYWNVPCTIGRAAAGATVVDVRVDPKASGVPSQAEGYLLKVEPGRVVIRGGDGHGVYYGAQTLKQLIRRDEHGVYIKPATVRDWPTLAMRGVHWFGGPNSWAFHQPMIERIVAPLKMNTMLYEADYTQWDTQKALWNPQLSTPKSLVRRTVNLARAHLLEPIPMVESLGHSDWMFMNGQNLDFVADTERTMAYDPNNPRTYQVLFPVMQEAIDLFHPRIFHIGHDEVTMYGRFPGPHMTGTVSGLYIQDVLKLRNWLAAKGLKTMLWGDQMLHTSDTNDAAWAGSAAEAAERRKALPKDLLIADWHYQSDSPDFSSVDVFRKDGFRHIIGTTWYEPANIRNFSKVLAEKKADGLIQSTWAGLATSAETANGGAVGQCVAYVLAAECAWNGGDKAFANSLYPEDVFERMLNRVPAETRSRKGFAVDLGPSEPLSARTLGLLPAGLTAPREGFQGVEFRIGAPCVLAGALEPASRPRSVDITLNRRVSALHFLWGTTVTAGRSTRVARVRVTYADGKAVETPILYAWQIFAFTDERPGKNAVVAWRGRTAAGRPARAHRWTWQNPRPGVQVARVSVISEADEAAPVVLAITGAE